MKSVVHVVSPSIRRARRIRSRGHTYPRSADGRLFVPLLFLGDFTNRLPALGRFGTGIGLVCTSLLGRLSLERRCTVSIIG